MAQAILPMLGSLVDAYQAKLKEISELNEVSCAQDSSDTDEGIVKDKIEQLKKKGKRKLIKAQSFDSAEVDSFVSSVVESEHTRLVRKKKKSCAQVIIGVYWYFYSADYT